MIPLIGLMRILWNEKGQLSSKEKSSPDLVDTLRSLRTKIKSCKIVNNRLIEAQEKPCKSLGKVSIS